MALSTSDFDYSLPEGLIAQAPARVRDESRLMVLDRASGRRSHAVFNEIPNWLRRGDVLVLNDTRVIPAAFSCCRQSGGRIEGQRTVSFPLAVTARTRAGTETFKATQGYDDGESVSWDVGVTVLPAAGGEAAHDAASMRSATETSSPRTLGRGLRHERRCNDMVIPCR